MDPMTMTVLTSSLVALVIATVAAVWDWRTGEIPNWLTLPPLVIAPLLYGLMFGPGAALRAVIALMVCGLVPYLLFRQGVMGGGDVKLFAALGAVTGFDLLAGLEIEMVSFVAAMLIAMGHLAWRGGLLRTLGNALRIAVNPVLPSERRATVSQDLMTFIRMGGPILVATAWCSLPRISDWWLAP